MFAHVTRWTCLIALVLASGAGTAAHGQDPPTNSKVAEASELGIMFDRYETQDKFGRTITYYLSVPPQAADLPAGQPSDLPLVLVISGSGCQSVWVKVGERVGGGWQNMALQAAKNRCRILIVEKPGVEYLFQPERPGSAIGAPEEFLREHTLERWGEANAAAIRSAWTLPGIDRSRTLCMGHSEGAIVAAKVAALLPEVTHAAVMSGGGATQLFSLTQLAMEPKAGDQPGDALKRRDAMYAGWAQVLEKPDSIEDFWLGHPYRRWSSFLATSTTEELLKSNAKVLAAQGTLDKAEHVTGHDYMIATLRSRGREVKEERLEGVGHGYSKEEEPQDQTARRELLARIFDWFLE